MNNRIKVLFLTTNFHKFEEAKKIFSNYNISLRQIDYPKIEIQSDYLEDIVSYALKNIKVINEPILVEDAGLFINYLNGFPGPYSSYVFKKIGNKGILKLLENVHERNAYFMSVVGLKTRKNVIKIFKGITYGRISRSEKGSRKFGYDPIFIPEGCSKTYAEMSINEKNKTSHRSKAFKKAIDWLINNLDNI